MFRKQLLTAVAALLTAVAFAPAANAAVCQGLACPGALPAFSPGYAASLPSVATSRDLETPRVSGFYKYGPNDAAQAQSVAYVVAPGEWNSAPADIKDLPVRTALSSREIASSQIIVYGPGSVVVAATPGTANAARVRKHHEGPIARKADYASCVSGWFCIYSSTGFGGSRGNFQSTSVWQNLVTYGWANRARSMVNQRTGWSILAKGQGGAGSRYCAAPISVDSTLANNGFDQNTNSVYNSTTSTKQSAWGCSN